MGSAAGKNIQRYRELLGMSQDELAKVLGVTRVSVSLWESGKSEPRMGWLQKMADYAGITTANLADSDGMKHVTMGSDGRLHDDPASRLRELRKRMLDADVATLDDCRDAERVSSQMMVRSGAEAMVLDMYRSLSEEGRETIENILAQFVKSGVYSPKEP